MSAWCLTADCSTVSFRLTTDPTIWVDVVRLATTDLAKWAFSGAWSGPSGWMGNIASGGFEFKLMDPSAYVLTPLTFEVGFLAQAGSTPENLSALTYTGSGRLTGPNGNPALNQAASIGGTTVTPEPVSMTLLGTGLLGLAGVKRRRRQQQAAAA